MTTQVLTATGPGPAIPLQYFQHSDSLPKSIILLPDAGPGVSTSGITFTIEATNDDPNGAAPFWFPMPYALPGFSAYMQVTGPVAAPIIARWQAVRVNIGSMSANGKLTATVSA